MRQILMNDESYSNDGAGANLLFFADKIKTNPFE